MVNLKRFAKYFDETDKMYITKIRQARLSIMTIALNRLTLVKYLRYFSQNDYEYVISYYFIAINTLSSKC